MSQERYLQIKKEHQVRKFVGRFLFILLAILDVLLVSSHSNYVPAYNGGYGNDCAF